MRRLYSKIKDIFNFSEAGPSVTRQPVATRELAYDYEALMGLLPDPDPILVKSGDSAETLEKLLADDHVTAVVQQRKKGTTKKEYKWQPGVNDEDETTPQAEELCKAFEKDLKKIKLKPVISGILDAPLLGFTPLELMWKEVDGRIALADIEPKPNRWFGYDEQNNPRFISLGNEEEGEELPWGKFVFARHEPTYDNPYGLRLLSRCLWPVAFKKGGVRFWVTFTEKYGMPYLIGKYRQGATPDEKQVILSALTKMVQDAVAVIPDGNAVDMLGGASETGNSGQAFKQLVDTMEASISKVIIGQTLTSDVSENGGAYSMSQTHEGILEDIRESDQSLVMDTMNEVARIYRDVNAPGVPAPTFTWHEPEEPRTEFAERDKALAEIGVQFRKEYFQRTYSLQEDDFDLVEPGNEGNQEAAEFAEAGEKQLTPEQKSLEGLADRGVEGTDLEQNEKLILDAVTSSSNFDEAFEKLLKLYPKMNMDSLQELLEQALFAADMHGRMIAQENAKERQGEEA